jgi:lipopolysaccharide transport system ATP-binding protein
VLFVSHNMAAVRSLCQSGILLESGRMTLHGTADEVVTRFVSGMVDDGLRATNTFERPKGKTPWMNSARLLVDGVPSAMVPMGSKLSLEVEFEAAEPIQFPRLGFVVATAEGERLFNISARYQPTFELDGPVTRGTICCDLGEIPLLARCYTIKLYMGDHCGDHHVVDDALTFEVVERDLYGTGKVPPPSQSLMWWPTTFRFEPEFASIGVTR